MNNEEYIKTRVDDQINWYDKKSIEFKKLSNILTVTIITLSSSAGLIVLIPYVFKIENNLFDLASPIINIFVAGALAYLKVNKTEDLQRTYRMTCEKLKSEKFLFLSEAGEYDIQNPAERHKLFVNRIESVLSTEIGNWAQLNEKKKGGR